MPKKKPPESLEGVIAFPLDKEVFITEASGKIHRSPEIGRLHLPAGTLIVLDVPEKEKWSGVQLAHSQYYRFTSKNTIRLHRHYKPDMLEISEFDDVYAFPPTNDKDTNKNNMIRKFANFLSWLGTEQIKKYNAYQKEKSEEGTVPIPELGDLKKQISKENTGDLVEEYKGLNDLVNEVCPKCSGIGTIFDDSSGTYINCTECNSGEEETDDDDIPF